MLLKQFSELEMEGILSNSFDKAHIILTPKSNKDTHKKKTIEQLLWFMQVQKLLANRNYNTSQNPFAMIKVASF